MHKWNFFKSARCVQVKLETDADVRALPELDRKLWTVLAAPATGIRFDADTRAFLDADGDGRIRAADVQTAVTWMARRFKSLDFIFARTAEIALDAFDESTDEGRTLQTTFRNVLLRAGKSATVVTQTDVASATDVFNGQPFNGDGVVTSASTSDTAVGDVVAKICAATGGVLDRSGAAGVNQANADAFFASVAARLAWLAEGAKVADADTRAAYGAYSVVKDKIEAFFTLPDDLPLVTDEPDRVLPLTSGVHPLWADAFRTFAQTTVAPILGDGAVAALTRSGWTQIKNHFAPYANWLAAEAGRDVAGLDADELAALAQDGRMQAAVNDLIAKDRALADEYGRLVDCSRALCYAAHLADWLCNFVNQANLYDVARDDVYRTGVLYIDGRACNLCFHVANMAAHAALAEKSKCCLLYVKLTRPATGATREVCAVVTAGTTAGLYVGRNGLFVDVDGNDWDAVVVKVVAAQTSLREAFWSPWAKIATTVSEQFRKFLSTRQNAAVTAVAAPVTTPAPAPAPAVNGAVLASSVAAIGMGVGMAGAACAGLVGVIAGLPIWKVLAGVAAIVLMVSLPSVVLAWFKLRARDLGAILNAGGWAVNRPLYFSVGLARTFTVPAKLPATAHVARDPYARHGVAWTLGGLLLLAVLVAGGVCWKLGVCPFAGCWAKPAAVEGAK